MSIMGTSLIPIANHNINFGERSYEDIATEILKVMQAAGFENNDFLIDFYVEWWGKPAEELIVPWEYRWEDEYFSYAQDCYVEIFGPFDLTLTFYRNYLELHGPPFRYGQWLELLDTAHRDLWREHLKAFVRLFGGNKIIYLADHIHPLAKYQFLEIPFDEIEAKLRAEFGNPKATFEEVAANYRSSFFMEEF